MNTLDIHCRAPSVTAAAGDNVKACYKGEKMEAGNRLIPTTENLSNSRFLAPGSRFSIDVTL